jgi:hypothetical protein
VEKGRYSWQPGLFETFRFAWKANEIDIRDVIKRVDPPATASLRTVAAERPIRSQLSCGESVRRALGRGPGTSHRGALGKAPRFLYPVGEARVSHRVPAFRVWEADQPREPKGIGRVLGV